MQLNTLPPRLEDKGSAVHALWLELPQSLILKENVFFNQSAKAVWAYSDYVANLSLQQPDWLVDLFDSGDIERIPRRAEYKLALGKIFMKNPSLDILMHELRRIRSRELLRLVWQRVTKIQDPRQIAHLFSEFAEVILSDTVAYLSTMHQNLHGLSMDKDHRPCVLYVLGLGKLGGSDLNFSSDIDVIFTYFTPHYCETKSKEWDPNQYFSKLVQTVVKVLTEVTPEGFVFRVDLRLRPFGQSGPVVMSYTAMEQYYQQHGREWERYALIKARILNEGPVEEMETLKSLLKRFSYRRYVDYSVIEALRHLKGLMDKQMQEPFISEDIKLGRGGLREIEFIVQTFQLLKGGKDPRLQTPHLQTAITFLGEEGYLPLTQARQLGHDYDVLRSVEDSLQMIADRQTQSYPNDELNRMRLAWIMGYSTWDDLMNLLTPLRTRVSQQFEALFAVREHGVTQADCHKDGFFKLWNLKASFSDWANMQSENKEVDWEAVTTLLTTFRNSHAVSHLSKEARLRLDQLMPLVLAVIVQSEIPFVYLERFLKVISAVLRRSTYLSLLIENKNALFHLIQCCGQSLWMSEQLAQYPILLDSLLDRRLSLLAFDQIGLENRLEQALLATPEEDTESQLEILRQIKNEYTLQAAQAYLTGQCDDEKLSHYLSEIAAALLNVVARLAWCWVKIKYALDDLDERILPPWAILAYGTLGGREMGFQSDLDLVFLYDNGADEGTTLAQQRAEYSYQWARRVLYWLELKTYNGYLYKADIQLRPSGQAGLLVSDMAHFEAYQMKEAWLWEHQALLRARIVAGDSQIVTQFSVMRQRILKQDRNIQTLKQDILAMRQRMLSHRTACPPGKFDVKQGVGGLIDIEFMIQFLALNTLRTETTSSEISSHRQWLQWVGDLGKIDSKAIHSLLAIECFYRLHLNQASLQNKPAWVDEESVAEERQFVQDLWKTLLL